MEQRKQQEQQQQIDHDHQEDFKIKTVDDILKFYTGRNLVNCGRSS